MFGDALGLIETFGMVPAVEAADIAVKSAHVRLQGCRYVGAGLVTVVLTGDITSVKAAVSAGSAAARQLGQVRSVTVIGRTGEGLETLLTSPELAGPAPKPPKDSGSEKEIEPRPLDGANAESGPEETPVPEGETPTPSAAAAPVKKALPDLSGIKKMKVSRLRHLARQVEGIRLSREDIKFARKNDLIQAITDVCGQDKE